MSTVDFRCEQCGKLLSVDAEPGSLVPCPHCQKKVAVPAGLASLPRPQVPGAPAATPPPPPPAAVSPDEFQPAEESKLAATMSLIMPWVLSLFLHAGMVLILFFFGLVIGHKAADKNRDVEDITVYGDEFARTLSPALKPGDLGPSPEAMQNKKDTKVTGYSSHEALMASGTAKEGKQVSLIGSAAGGGAAGGGYARFGLTPGGGGGGAGPGVKFLGSQGNAHHVVYVIDNSGSMLERGVIDAVKQAMRVSLGRLDETAQDFHMIFFNDNRTNTSSKAVPWGFPTPPRLLPASKQYKVEAAKWLDEVIAQGQGSDPRPAMEQAFAVLKASDKKPGKMIFLLTDGDFPDNDAVLKRVRELNSGHDVVINTYLYGKAADSFVKIMKAIAEETHGAFKQIDQ